MIKMFGKLLCGVAMVVGGLIAVLATITFFAVIGNMVIDTYKIGMHFSPLLPTAFISLWVAAVMLWITTLGAKGLGWSVSCHLKFNIGYGSMLLGIVGVIVILGYYTYLFTFADIPGQLVVLSIDGMETFSRVEVRLMKIMDLVPLLFASICTGFTGLALWWGRIQSIRFPFSRWFGIAVAMILVIVMAVPVLGQADSTGFTEAKTHLCGMQMNYAEYFGELFAARFASRELDINIFDADEEWMWRMVDSTFYRRDTLFAVRDGFSSVFNMAEEKAELVAATDLARIVGKIRGIPEGERVPLRYCFRGGQFIKKDTNRGYHAVVVQILPLSENLE
ncbi:MAG: hypothetical protein ABIJ92_04400 [Candidatus Aenigmatarchaeota archaeon]